jgi:hypothetical protein
VQNREVHGVYDAGEREHGETDPFAPAGARRCGSCHVLLTLVRAETHRPTAPGSQARIAAATASRSAFKP